MAEKTPNLNLSLPSQNDPANVEVLNENFRQLDEHAMVHPDMAVNDPNDLRYIENRLAYKEEGTVVFFPTMTVSNVGIEGDVVYVGQYLRYPLVAGNTYTVTVNGESRDIVAQAAGSTVVLDGPGNYVFFSDGENTRIRLPENTSATYGIVGEGEVVKPVDSEYLTFSGRPEIEELTDGDMVPVARPDGTVALIPSNKIGGGGMPEGTAPNQMMVTDGGGVAKWAEREIWDGEKDVLVPEITFSNVNLGTSSNYTYSQDLMAFTPVVGETYTVWWSGEKYTVEATGSQSVIYLNTEPTAEIPFSMRWVLPNSAGVKSFDDPTPTVKIARSGMKKLDPKFLPEGGVGWTEEGGEVTLWDVTYTEEELTSVLEDGVLTAANPIGLVDGITYKVTWEGTEYESTAVTASPQAGVNIVYVGNGSFIGGNDTGDPFFVCDSPDGSLGIGFMAVIIDPVFPFAAKIVGDGEIVHGIDPKYLPKGGFGYSEEAVTEKALFEGTITQEEWDTYDGGIFKTEEAPALIEGNTYRVLWPDGYHECKAIMVTVPDAGTFPVIGNTSLLGIGEDTGEPFAIAYVHDVEQIASQGIYTIVFLPVPTTETFPLDYVVFGEEKTEIIHTIDKKYLPSSGGSGTKVTITKDESGNYTTDTRLVDVYDMTAAELQAAITVHDDRYEMAVYGLSKWLYGGSVPALVFYMTEASDNPTQITRRMSWMGNEQIDMIGPDPNFEEL